MSRYDFDGSVTEYTVEEEPIDGYETTITGSAEDGFTITNTEVGEEPKAPKEDPNDEDDPEKEKPKDDPDNEEDSEDEDENDNGDTESNEENDDGDILPKTATNNFNLLLIGILFVLAGSIVSFFFHRRKKGTP